MQFPKNRTDIMDHVAITASDKSMTDKEKEPLIRLALMHWNHVEDKSLPETEYEGFDLDWVSPANQLDLGSLISGSEDYIDERKEVIFAELDRVQKELLGTLDMQRDPNLSEQERVYGAAERQNALNEEMIRIAEKLKAMGDQVIDRVITVNIDSNLSDLRVDKLMDELKDDLRHVPSAEVGIDYRQEEYRHGDRLRIFAPNALVSEVLSSLSALIPEGNEPQINVEEHHVALPSFKDMIDLEKREISRKRMEREMSSEKAPDLDFSFLHK